MNAARIQQLAWYLPESETAGYYANDAGINLGDLPYMADTMLYIDCYKNLRFGWDFVQKLHNNNCQFPSIIEADDNWLWRAFMFMKGHYDPSIAAALTLTSSNGRYLRQAIESMLVHKDTQAQHISSKLNLPVATVMAYEKLFFNLLDRREDTKFLAEIVYPETRLVELYAEYMREAAFSELLKRSSYNNGVDELLHFMGMASNPYEMLQSYECAGNLELGVMAQAVLLHRAGFTNMSSTDVQALHRGQQLLAAAKQSGVGVEDQSAFQKVGDALFGEFKEVKRTEAKTRLIEAQSKGMGPSKIIEAESYYTS